MANSRKTAVKALCQVFENGAYSNITLNKTLAENELSANEKQFATALFYGVLDRAITLDYIISKHIKTPIKKLSPFALQTLRVAIYQIMFMDKIPESAAVNEAVKIIKSSKEKYLAGFVNGVLRSILREKTELPQGDDIKSLEIRYSCPEWIVKRIVDDYGIEIAKKYFEHTLLTPPVTVRVNTIKISPDDLILYLAECGVRAQKTPLENSLEIIGGIDVSKNRCYLKGLFHIQDIASQTAVKILSPHKSERVLDLCAAPGGKTFTMAQYMENKGEIIACDIYEHKIKLISKGAKRLGIDIIKPQLNDASVYNENLGLFDAVLCDAPCSGLGVIRRKPEIKYKNTDEYADITAVQSQILENAVMYLKDGGRILYSTCTLRKCENEGVIQGFLDKHPCYELKYQHTFMPQTDGTDGFYCALLQKSR